MEIIFQEGLSAQQKDVEENVDRLWEIRIPNTFKSKHHGLNRLPTTG